MKRKLCMFLSALLVMSTLTGCNMDEFKQKLPWNKGSAQVDTEQAPVSAHNITVKEGLEVEPGTTLAYTDVVTLDGEDELNMTASLFIDVTGTVSDTYTVPESAEADTQGSIDLVIQFNDGSEWSGSIPYTVVGPKAPFGDDILNSLQQGGWETYKIPGPDVDGEKTYRSTITYNAHVLELSRITFMDMSKPDNFKYEWQIGEQTPDETKEESKEGISILSTSTEEIGFRIVKEFMKAFMGTGVDLTDEELAKSEVTTEDMESITEMKNYLTVIDNYIRLFKEEVATVTTEDTPYSIYDDEGNTYHVKRVVANIDATKYGGSSYSHTNCYYISYKGNCIIFLQTDTPYLVASTGSPSMQGDDNNEFDTEELETLTDYETFKQYMIDNKGLESKKPNDTNVEDDFGVIADNLVLGDITSWVKAKDAPTDVQIEVGDGSSETTENEKMLAETKPTYQSKHPEVYNWPNNDIKYRRYDYTIDEDTSFRGIIIMPDGKIIRSSDTDEDFEFYGGAYISGDGTTDPNYGNTGAKNEQYEIISAYGSYMLSSEGFNDMQFQKNLSTSGRLVFTYNNTRCYIETGRASTINNYIANCMYNTEQFSNGAFEVQESPTRTTAKYGTITDYVIRYQDKDKKDQLSAYMSVYNINNDYLICYSDELMSDLNIYRQLLEGMVTAE